jgi:DNA replication protein DnaC
MTTTTTTELGSKLAYLTRALKTPTIARVWEDLAAQARDRNWSHEEYLTAVLERQVADRESAGTTMRIRTAHFPAVKTLEEFNLDHLPSLRRDLLAHLATGTFVAKAENVILLGPPGIGKTHLAIGLGVKATQAGYSVLFDTASNWITRLATAHQSGQLEAELKKIRRYKLIIIDLCRHRDYVGLRAVRPGGAGDLCLRLGIVTGFRGRRGSCLEGGSGRGVPRRVW